MKDLLKQPVVKYGLIAGGVYVLYKVATKLFPDSALTKATNEIKTLEGKGIKATYPDSVYYGFADSIYSAGINTYGTDEQAIYSIFSKMQNDLDVAKLVSAFGTRRAEFSFVDVTLGGFLQSELDANELNVVNNTLSQKGIKYRF